MKSMLNTSYYDADEFILSSAMSVLSTFTTELAMMMEDRLADDRFHEIVAYLSNISKGIATKYLDEGEQEQQLRFCSQWQFTFSQLYDEILFYIARLERHQEVWWSYRNEEARKAILLGHKKEIDRGLRTKSHYGAITKDDLRDYVNRMHTKELEQWARGIEKAQRMAAFLNNLLEDIKHRSIILMSLRRERK